MSEDFRHIFLKRASIVLLVLLSFANARFVEMWHFHTEAPQSGNFLKSCESESSFSQESCSLCKVTHHDIPFLKAPEEFSFFKNLTVLHCAKVVFKTSLAILSTSSRAPPHLF